MFTYVSGVNKPEPPELDQVCLDNWRFRAKSMPIESELKITMLIDEVEKLRQQFAEANARIADITAQALERIGEEKAKRERAEEQQKEANTRAQKAYLDYLEIRVSLVEETIRAEKYEKALEWYADAKWEYNGDDDCLVKEWPDGQPEWENASSKDGGAVAKIVLDRS